MSHKAIDLEYPAVAMDNVTIVAGTFFYAGNNYAFRNSVQSGKNNLQKYYREISKNCPATKWLVAGYSQGAAVMHEALGVIPSNRLIYAAFFGDPKLYLPEGRRWWWADSCRHYQMSSYRMWVPNCAAYQGILGGRKNYEPVAHRGKYGTWCSWHDFICGGTRQISNNSGHMKYATNNHIASMFGYVKGMIINKKLTISVDLEDAILGDELSLRGKRVARLANGGLDGFVDGIEGDGVLEPEALTRLRAEEEAELQLRLEGLSDVCYYRRGEVIVLDWSDARVPTGVKYLYVKLDGFPLGYVEVERENIEIHGVEFESLESLEFAWVREDLELYEGAEVALRDEKGELVFSDGKSADEDDGFSDGVGVGEESSENELSVDESDVVERKDSVDVKDGGDDVSEARERRTEILVGAEVPGVGAGLIDEQAGFALGVNDSGRELKWLERRDTTNIAQGEERIGVSSEKPKAGFVEAQSDNVAFFDAEKIKAVGIASLVALSLWIVLEIFRK